MSVLDAMREFMIGANANVGYGSETSWLAEQMVESARDAAADLLNCAANEVILGNNMTTVRSIGLPLPVLISRCVIHPYSR